MATQLARRPNSPAPAPAPRGYALAVIVPTYNEAANVPAMIAALDATLAGIATEIVFVDDWSTDGTAAAVEHAAAGRTDVRVVRRFGRRGLSSAAIEGMLSTMAPVVALLDGDGQHDERLLPRLFRLVEGGRADVAIGSRYCADGSIGTWNAHRAGASRFATRLSRLVIGDTVSDPMSGFFVMRRETVEALVPRLSGRGFKLLFDLLSAAETPLRTVELPFEFRTRQAGESKLGAGVAIDYALAVADRLVRRWVPPRFVMFAGVGTLGLGVHLSVLRAAMTGGVSFAQAQAAAVIAAIAFNFLANNALTFRDRRLRGWRLAAGLASFYAVCGLGALANIGAGAALFAADGRWWLSGLAGALIGSVWNFAAASLVTWRR